MKTLRLLYQRFISQTPKVLRKLQVFLGSALITIGGAVVAIDQYAMPFPITRSIFLKALLIIPFIILALNFSTSDKTLVEKEENNNLPS